VALCPNQLTFVLQELGDPTIANVPSPFMAFTKESATKLRKTTQELNRNVAVAHATLVLSALLCLHFTGNLSTMFTDPGGIAGFAAVVLAGLMFYTQALKSALGMDKKPLYGDGGLRNDVFDVSREESDRRAMAKAVGGTAAVGAGGAGAEEDEDEDEGEMVALSPTARRGRNKKGFAGSSFDDL
jgi:hypothetical protein